MSTSVDINKLFELIDLYKYASVKGVRTELIVTPFYENGKVDDSKRLITVGLQGGISRDRKTFLVNSSNVFDDIVLPQIISYFAQNDTLLKWDVVSSELEDITSKGVIETESGNVIHLETFNKDLYDEVLKDKKDVDKSTTYKDDFLTENDKIWDEIICYAKKRRTIQDFYVGNGFSTRDQENIYNFISILAETKRGISSGNSNRDKVKNQKFMEELFKDKKKLLELGLSDRLINKISDTSIVEKLAVLVGAEKRIRKKLDLNNPVIKSKIEFAVGELDKVNYFDLKNAKAVEFENGRFSSSQPDAILKLKQLYSVNRVYSKTVTENYRTYCDEILTYLENKALTNKRIVRSKLKTPLTLFEEYDDSIVDDYDRFREIINLVIKGKTDLEHYEFISEPSVINPKERQVRISILDGVSRNDTFNFRFTDGDLFDENLFYIIEDIGKTDPNFMSVITTDYDGNLPIVRTVLHESVGKNEILIKNPTDKLAYRRSSKIIDKFKKIKEDIAYEDRKKKEKSSDIISKLKKIEKEINEETKRQDEILSRVGIVDDSTVSFEQLHEYAKRYKLGEIDKKLAIYDRIKGTAYNPPSDSEKRNIEFAIYWSVMAGLNESSDDVVFGEKYAFNEDNKKLFDIMDVQFKESLRRRIPVDMESLRNQFIESKVKNADKIYERLFRNNHYIDYVKLYYRKSLNSLKNSIKRNADLQAEELIKKREKAENMDASSNENAKLKAAAEELAREIYGSTVDEDLKRAARELALEIQKTNEQEELREAAMELARKINNDDEIEILKVEAEKYAKTIQNANEQAELKEAAEETAKKIQANNERIELLEGAEELAREINKTNERVDLKNAAKETAKMIQDANEKADLKNAAEEYARDIQSSNERKELKAAAQELARRILDLDENNKLREAAIRFAKEIELTNEMAELKAAADLFAREIQSNNERIETLEAAEQYAKDIQDANNRAELKEAAEQYAKDIQGANERADLKNAAEEVARQIQDANEKADLKNAAEEAARQIQDANERADLKNAAEEAARQIQIANEKADLKNAAEQYAKDIHRGNELAEIKEIAKQYAKDIQHSNDIIFLKEGAKEQAKLLAAETLVEDAKKYASDREIQKLVDAYEVVESYSNQDQPVSIKVFFDKEKGGKIAEVILSNGVGANESVMYREEFGIDKLQSEIIPMLCDFYAKDNEVVYNKSFEVPNTNKGGLVVVGRQEKTFQVSNADRTFVSYCQNVLAESLDKYEIKLDNKVK